MPIVDDAEYMILTCTDPDCPANSAGDESLRKEKLAKNKGAYWAPKFSKLIADFMVFHGGCRQEYFKIEWWG